MVKLSQSRILVVDDEPGMRRTLSRILKAKGFIVEVAEDGHAAIGIAAEFRPDILLMDLRMPGIDGVETWRRLRPLCPDACVVFMSAYSSDKRTSEARSEGAVDVLSKPLDIDNLCQMISSVGRPVLVVDDDRGFRDSLQRALRHHGFRVTTAADEADAVAAFSDVPESVVLLDMKLNEASGLDVLRQIHEAADTVAVILMTGYSELQHQMQDGLRCGATASFTKPLDINDLVLAIRRLTEAGDASQ